MFGFRKKDKKNLYHCYFLCLLAAICFWLPSISIQATEAKKGDTVTDGTFTYIILTKARAKKDGTVSVYGLNKNTFNDKDEKKSNDSPKKLEVPARIKYREGYYNITATGSSGKATLAGKSSNYQYYWGNAKKIILPDTITKIGDNSFAKTKTLKEITIPSKVTAIGGEAFYHTGLTEITIPASVEFIGRAAFWKCKKLEKVIWQEGIEVIGKWAFQESGLEQAVLPEGLTEIKQAAFSKCVSLKQVELPSSVEKIGAGVFSSCEKLKKVAVKAENRFYQAIEQAIYTKDGTIVVDGNAATGSFEIEDNVEIIGKCAFEGNKKLTEITIPDSVKLIKEGAFLNCKKLKKVVIGKGVTKLGASSFAKCFSLKKITIPNSVKKIERNAFYNCRKIKTVTMGEQVSYLGSRAFAACQSLQTIEIPGTISMIGKRAFYQNTSMTNLEILEGVEHIDEQAFASCALSSVSLPESIRTIGAAAFQGNKDLEEIYLPAAVTEIFDNVFASCKSLTNLEVSDENETYCTNEGALMNKNSTRLIAWPSAEGDLVLEDTITTIGSYALQDTAINSIIIPSSVMRIEEGAFANCKELLWVQFEGNEIILPSKTKNKENISLAIFYGCFALQTVSAPQIDKEDQIQNVFAERLKEHMDKNGTLAWLAKVESSKED